MKKPNPMTTPIPTAAPAHIDRFIIFLNLPPEGGSFPATVEWHATVSIQ
jgi:hypothetical protein